MIKEIELSKPQMKVMQSRTPLTLFMAGQRTGKSYLIGIKTGNYVIQFPKVPGMIAANTYLQLTTSTMVAVRKAWKDTYGMVEYDRKGTPGGHYVVNKRPPEHFVKFINFDSYHNIISFANGAVIYMASLDNYMVHDGKELGWAELDETKDTKEDALLSVILGRLSFPGLYYHNKTKSLSFVDDIQTKELKNYTPFNPCCINTSPSIGVVKWINDMFFLDENEIPITEAVYGVEKMYFGNFGNKSVCVSSTYNNSHNLPDNYIENRLSLISEEAGKRFIYGLPFGRSGDSYFRQFKTKLHVGEVVYDPMKDIHVTFDFNVKPYMTMECAQINIDEVKKEFQICFFDEYCLSSPKNSTKAVCQEFVKDYGEFDPYLFFYGDASGDYRQAGSGDHTQFDTVREEFQPFISRSSDKVPRKNKSVLNRRDFIDEIFEYKKKIHYNGEEYTVMIIVDPKCENLISDLQWLKEGNNEKLKEKVKDPETGISYEKIGHTSDAFEYLVCELLDEYFQKI